MKLFISIAILLTLAPSVSASAQSVATNAKPQPIEKPQEYRLSESTMTIVAGQACEAIERKDSKYSIKAKVLDTIMLRENSIKYRNAKVLANTVVKNAYTKCGVTIEQQ
jgi:HD superfamily phosphodiesterase